MKDIYLSIGHNVGDVREHDTAGIVSAVRRILGVDDLTAWECAGLYWGMDEPSTRVELLALDDAKASAILDAIPSLAAHLRQESIAVTVRPTESVLIMAAEAAAEKSA